MSRAYLCNKCKEMIVMNAFSSSNCEICGRPINTPHIPAYRICEECSQYSGDCQQCGVNIEDRNNS